MHVTPESVFTMSRREVMKALGITAAAALVPSALQAADENATPALTTEEAFGSYNNFYEFGFTKREPAQNAQNFKTEGWVIQVGGLVENPLSFSVPELKKRFGAQRHVYRMRCVEGWSMTIPWNGFALKDLLALARPTANARFVAFESLADPAQMPSVAQKSFPFPYREGLRLDEAVHPLTLLATGAYDKELPPQCGAPIRLVVPWKYGFKSLKSLVKITLTQDQPATTWDSYNPREYGFYSNVNPKVDHQRWSQASEKVIGPGGLAKTTIEPTKLFNGYDEVAVLYKDMDLTKYY